MTLEHLREGKHNGFDTYIWGNNMYKNLGLLFILVAVCSCSEPVEEIESDSFLNIAGARVGLASQQPIDWDSQAIDPLYEYESKNSVHPEYLYSVTCMYIHLFI